MRRFLVCLLVMLCASSTLQAQTVNWIFQLNDTYNDPNDPNYPNLHYFDIRQFLNTVFIYDAEPNQPFEFEARVGYWDGPDWVDQGQGLIDFIGSDPNDPNGGPPMAFTIVIDGQGAHTYGAENVKEISFDNYQNLTIGRVEISGDLGDPNDPNGIIQADAISGPLLIGGQILDDVEINLLAGDIECANMQDLTASETANDPGITIDGTYQGAMLIDGTIAPVELGALGASGWIDVLSMGTASISGDLDGVIDVASDTSFTVIYADGNCAGDVATAGGLYLSLGGQLSGSLDAAGQGYATVDSGVSGSINFGAYGLVYIIGGDLSGSINIDGYGDVDIEGDVLDEETTHVSIGELGAFSCLNVELTGARERWLEFGPQSGPIVGDVHIRELSGVVWCRSRFDGTMDIRRINAGPTGDPDMPHGGIYLAAGSGPSCYVRVGRPLDPDTGLVRGWIFAENGPEADGLIEI